MWLPPSLKISSTCIPHSASNHSGTQTRLRLRSHQCHNSRRSEAIRHPTEWAILRLYREHVSTLDRAGDRPKPLSCHSTDDGRLCTVSEHGAVCPRMSGIRMIGDSETVRNQD